MKMDVDVNGTPAVANGNPKTEGIKQYYVGKIEGLMVRDKQRIRMSYFFLHYII